MTTLFEQYQELKPNAQIRVAMWLAAGLPLTFAQINDHITTEEATRSLRNAALNAGPSDLKELKALVTKDMRARGIRDDFKPPQIASTTWAKKLKGRRRIMWTPGEVSKQC